MARNLTIDRLSNTRRFLAQALVFAGVEAPNERKHMAAQLSLLITSLDGAARVRAVRERDAYRLLAHMGINVMGVQLEQRHAAEAGQVVVHPEFIATVGPEEFFGGALSTLPPRIGNVPVMYQCERTRRVQPSQARPLDFGAGRR